MQLLARGAEADICLGQWNGKKAVHKHRPPKAYVQKDLDAAVRRQRVIHEATIMSAAKLEGVATPFVYYINPEKALIIMEFVEGRIAKENLSLKICAEMGRMAALLHAGGIIHGDLTTSNFIISQRGLVLLDFGLAHYSTRLEDMATDIRLTKEVMSSAHVDLRGAFDSFSSGYASAQGQKTAGRVLANVAEIERRGRYARVD